MLLLLLVSSVAGRSGQLACVLTGGARAPGAGLSGAVTRGAALLATLIARVPVAHRRKPGGAGCGRDLPSGARTGL
ncbi:hypothetical protein GCM10010261_60690 [Streptomyces pilosus]|nr:hypothetical protein GCM10010261_60690 [Streptomyces pilosus]